MTNFFNGTWYRRMMLLVPVAIAGSYIVLCVAVYLLQEKMVYHPTVEMVSTPEDWGIPFEEASFRAEDGIVLNGWFLPGKKNSPVVLFCHGNAGNISGRQILLSIFHDLGVSVFIFDYRGYGKSGGTPSEEGTGMDARAAWNLLVEKKQIPMRKIVLFGRSLGGGVATHLATKVDFGGLILMSTFTALPDVGQRAYPYLPIRLLSKYEYPNLANIHAIHRPVLVLHGVDDEMIPFYHGRILYSAANNPKQFVKLQGGHNDAVIVSRKQVEEAFGTYLSRFFSFSI